MKKRYNILALLLFLSAGAFAQQDPIVSQYMFNGMFINPAYTGSHKYYNATLLYRKQWVDFKGAPNTQILSLDGPVKGNNSAVGILAANDKIGVTGQTEIYGYYAYHLQIGAKTRLSMGLRGGINYYRADLTELQVWDQEDDVFNSDIRGKVLPNFGTGLYLYTPTFYAGLAVPHLLNYDEKTRFSVDLNEAPKTIRHYYLHTGYVINKDADVIFKPNFLIRYVKNAPVQVDLNLNVLFVERIWIGASYRTGDALVGILELQASKRFRIGYAYDYPINDIRRYNNGSHEFMLAYDFGVDILKMKSPRYF